MRTIWIHGTPTDDLLWLNQAATGHGPRNVMREAQWLMSRLFGRPQRYRN